MLPKFKSKGSSDRLPELRDDPEFAAAQAEYDRLTAKHSAAAARVADLERRVREFGPVDQKSPAERAAVLKFATEEDSPDDVKQLALTLEALEPLERELAQARAEVALRERPMNAAGAKLDALRPVVRERQCDAHVGAAVRPAKAKLLESLKASLAALQQHDGLLDAAKAHFGFSYAGHQEVFETAAKLAALIDLLENGPKPAPPKPVQVDLVELVAKSRAEDAKRVADRQREAEEYTRKTGWKDPFARG